MKLLTPHSAIFLLLCSLIDLTVEKDEIEKIKDASRSHYKQFSTEGHSCT